MAKEQSPKQTEYSIDAIAESAKVFLVLSKETAGKDALEGSPAVNLDLLRQFPVLSGQYRQFDWSLFRKSSRSRDHRRTSFSLFSFFVPELDQAQMIRE